MTKCVCSWTQSIINRSEILYGDRYRSQLHPLQDKQVSQLVHSIDDNQVADNQVITEVVDHITTRFSAPQKVLKRSLLQGVYSVGVGVASRWRINR